MTLRTERDTVLGHGYDLRDTLSPAGFQTFGDKLRPEDGRIHETIIERQDANAIHRLTPRRSCEDDRDDARS